MNHLISNSGIQFIVTEAEFNPNEPLLVEGRRPLRYSFCEMSDFLTNELVLDLVHYCENGNVFIPFNELESENQFIKNIGGKLELDELGLPRVSESLQPTLFTTFREGDPELMTINSLSSLMLPDKNNPLKRVPAFYHLLDHWLPVPMFEVGKDDMTMAYPTNWCRVKMSVIGDGAEKGRVRFRLIWAFDTTTTDDSLSTTKPTFANDNSTNLNYALCNRVDEMRGFLPLDDTFSQYLAALLGIDVQKIESNKYRYIAYYIYFISFLRLSGAAPEVTLYDSPDKETDVDLVLDIGNSRTCGVLFEKSDFTKAVMLELRDMSEPYRTYNQPFDMRFVFRKADFGGAMTLDEDVFEWRSFVRLGEEAKRLTYRSLEELDTSELRTNYSSPKRYLWDDKPYDGQWKNMTTVDDPTNVFVNQDIYIKGLSDYFEPDGTYNSDGALSLSNNFSRGSLMTFVMIEIYLQAIAQINSMRFREKHGDFDVRRRLSKVILTCPTAMPVAEQIKLREAAVNAYDVLMKNNPVLKPLIIAPSPAGLKTSFDAFGQKKLEWAYDEASCGQLVYLYAEIVERYKGEYKRFFDIKGHVRSELKEQGYDKKSVTIGSVDIGAGTTDLMICSYEYDEGSGNSGRITPIPKFWDSFYLAGDEILRKIVHQFVIEGNQFDSPNLGCIESALKSRLYAMTDDELRNLPCLKSGKESAAVYKSKVDNIIMSTSPQQRMQKLDSLANDLVNVFFGADISLHYARDRRCRTDFNTQISVPIAQFMLERLRRHRPSKVYGFNDIFTEYRPADYLLDHFADHFGFRFEELNWRYDPQVISEYVKATMEPLIKQLSIILFAYNCDIIVLSGRPTSIDSINELFIKYYPLSPDRLVSLNEEQYRVGSWYPFSDGEGFFFDQKSVVAVGAMIGYLASHEGFKGLVLDFNPMMEKMKPTSNYIGLFDSKTQMVRNSVLSPENSMATLEISNFPAHIGCKQLDYSAYQARPLYAIYNNSQNPVLRISLSRSFEDKEVILLEEVTDLYNNPVTKGSVELIQQSIADDGKYWLDKGDFELSLK